MDFGILYGGVDMRDCVSVIVPVYNVESYLLECLDSISSQTYTNIEIVAVNDGSTDSSRSLLETYQEKEKRLVIYDKENGGLSDARNYGIKRAKGNYIICVDGDDRIHPKMIEDLYYALQENEADISVCDMLYFYETKEDSYSSGGDFICTNIHETPELIAINNSACNKMYHKDLFKDIEFPVGLLFEDLATIPILLYNAKKVVKVNGPYYGYRQREGSIMHTASKRIFEIYDALDRVRDYIKAHGNEENVLEAFNSLYIVHGLDLTTLKIREFDDKDSRIEYLKENMERLKKSYPNYNKDRLYKHAPFKKKIIYRLLSRGMYGRVLKLYDR